MAFIPDPLRCNVFDYTCDDCMLPANHYDPPEINDGYYHKSGVRMIVLYNPAEPATKLMRKYHKQELQIIESLGLPTYPVKCGMFGIDEKVETCTAGPKFEGPVFARHYAKQSVYYRQYVHDCGSRLVVPKYWEANDWWFNTPDNLQQKYFARRFGYKDIKLYGYLDEIAQVKALNAMIEQLFDDYAYQGQLFLKSPEKGNLPSRLYELDDAKEQIAYWVALACHNRLSTLIWSEPMAIGSATTKYGKAEYRCFIVGSECSTVSLYTDRPGDTGNAWHIAAFANKFAQEMRPLLPHAYCLDIAELQDGRLAVVELNDIAASGYFADNDIAKIYTDLERASA